VGDIATELGLNESLLHRWYKRYSGGLTGGATTSQREREDMERMRRRLRELEQENALLKKAAALFAKEMKSWDSTTCNGKPWNRLGLRYGRCIES
jgi:transposase